MAIVSTRFAHSHEPMAQTAVGRRPHSPPRRRTLRVLVLAPFALALADAHAADALPASELARIEGLLDAIAQMRELKFVRSGTAYDAATAVRFLRAKWDRYRAKVSSAEDFIREIATKSETTGERYRVRGADGKEEDSAAFLGRVLAGQRR
jgi:hypothetical protein